MGVMASHITNLTIVYSIVYSGADQEKKSKLRVIGLLCEEFTGYRRIPRTNGQ